MRPFLILVTTLALAATTFPAANVLAHVCSSLTPQAPANANDPDTGCNGASCPGNAGSIPHDHVNTLPPAECYNNGDKYRNCPHGSPHSHSYGSGGSGGARSEQATGGDERGAGVTTVSDTNTADCDGSGPAGKGPGPSAQLVGDDVPDGDFDGDYETGIGGGFFGYGPWADEPTCNYGLRTHGASVTVSDVVHGSNVQFVIGADDTGGPVITPVTDPTTGEPTGEYTCSTDGSITPGDPATDPTADADDCLTDVYTGSGSTCGAGGDGGYWVFLSGLLVTEGTGSVSVNNAPTAGTITA